MGGGADCENSEPVGNSPTAESAIARGRGRARVTPKNLVPPLGRNSNTGRLRRLAGSMRMAAVLGDVELDDAGVRCLEGGPRLPVTGSGG